MGFWSKLFGGGDEEVSEAVREARKRHGIQPESEAEKAARESRQRPENEMENYDAWEDIRNIRTSFFVGSWAGRKLHLIRSDDKLKQDLDKLQERRREEAEQKEAKRREKEAKKRGQGES